MFDLGNESDNNVSDCLKEMDQKYHDISLLILFMIEWKYVVSTNTRLFDFDWIRTESGIETTKTLKGNRSDPLSTSYNVNKREAIYFVMQTLDQLTRPEIYSLTYKLMPIIQSFPGDKIDLLKILKESKEILNKYETVDELDKDTNIKEVPKESIFKKLKGMLWNQ